MKYLNEPINRNRNFPPICIQIFKTYNKNVYKSHVNSLRLRKVDFVLAVGIWVGLGPDLGLEKTVRK